MKTELSTFTSAFLGQQVTITVNLNQTINFQSSPEQSVESMPIFYEGFLLDEDDQFYYLGEDPIEINQAIKKVNVVHIMSIEEKDVFNQILDEMPGPVTEEEIN